MMLLTRCLRGSFPQAPYKSSTLSHCSPVPSEDGDNEKVKGGGDEEDQIGPGG